MALNDFQQAFSSRRAFPFDGSEIIF